MATSDIVCSICEQHNKTKIPVSWCPECEEALCSSCQKHHRVAKLSRGHTTISIEDYKKLPQFILNIKLYCQEHNEKFLNYCINHASPICRKCLTLKHKKCEETPALEDVVQNVKSSAGFNSIERDLQDVLSRIQIVIKDRKSNLKKINEQRKEILDGIRKMRNEINKHLDTLEKNIISELESKEDLSKKSIQKIQKTLEDKGHQISEIVSNHETIHKYASNFQTFIGLKELEKISHGEEMYLQSLTNDGSLDHVSISWSVNEEMKSLIEKVTTFGVVQTITNPTTLSLQTRQANKAQIFVRSGPPVSLQLKQDINMEEGYIHGRCILPNKNMVFTAGNKNKLLVYKSDGSFLSNIPIGQYTYDVAYIGDDKLAVSTGGSGNVLIIDAAKCRILRTIPTSSNVWGMTQREGKIIFCSGYEGLKMLDLDNDSITTLFEDTTIIITSHVTSFQDRTCYTSPRTNTVTILDSDYNVISTFQDKALLKYPCGIAMDDHMNIYVTGYWSHNLVVIQPDGKQCHTLLSDKDGLERPTAVHYDENSKQLIVTNFTKKAFLYTVI